MDEVDNVSVEFPELVRDAGEKTAVTPEGNPVTDKDAISNILP